MRLTRISAAASIGIFVVLVSLAADANACHHRRHHGGCNTGCGTGCTTGCATTGGAPAMSSPSDAMPPAPQAAPAPVPDGATPPAPSAGNQAIPSARPATVSVYRSTPVVTTNYRRGFRGFFRR